MKLADFGLAKIKEGMTATRGVGTPHYMVRKETSSFGGSGFIVTSCRNQPPEMFDVSAALTNPMALDVYALAIIMWQLWYKTRPYKGIGTHALILQIMSFKRPLFEGEPEQGPPPPLPLMKLIQACWDQNPEKRPSATHVLRSIL